MGEGVQVIFGLAGSHVLAVYAALRDHGAIRHVTVKHENSAALMAEMHARITGKPGVVLVTAGPGATNSLSGVAQAYASATPLIHISGTVPHGAGKESFHGVDSPTFMHRLFQDVTKWSVSIERVEEIPAIFARAFAVAQSGRPGPVHIDIPINLFMGGAREMDAYAPRAPERRPIDDGTLARMAAMIRAAERPIICAGKGVLTQRAEDELAALSSLLSAPVLYANRDAWGVITESHPFCAGFFSTMDIFDNPFPVRLLNRADLVLLVGEREDTDPSKAAHAHGGGPVIAINCESDADQIDRQAAVAVVADAQLGLAGLRRHLERGARPHNAALARSLAYYRDGIRREIHARVDEAAARAGIMHPGQFIGQLDPLIDEHTIVVGDVGNHDVWSRVLLPMRSRDGYKPEGSWGEMGFAIPGAIGAKIAAPEKRVVAITGDGCFLMALADFGTALEQRTPVVYAILNDSQYGMMYMMLETRFGGAYESDLRPPDFVALARAFGADGERVTTVAAIRPALERAFAANVPYVLDIVCGYKFPYPDYAAALANLDKDAPLAW
jgi:acetolactate synthase-1/2/3 large subunit